MTENTHSITNEIQHVPTTSIQHFTDPIIEPEDVVTYTHEMELAPRQAELSESLPSRGRNRVGRIGKIFRRVKDLFS